MNKTKLGGSASLLALLAAGGLAACTGGFDDKGGALQDDCVSNREYFSRTAWPEVLESKCVSCHGPGGIADQKGSAFKIQPQAYPGFIDANLANFQDVSRTKIDGVNVLLVKPTGGADHGGGAVIEKGSAAYAALEEMIRRVDQGELCAEEDNKAALSSVQLLSANETLRKATLHLAGRLPSITENEAVAKDGDAALQTALDAIMKEDAFYARMVELYNDQWLTDRYLRDSNNVLNASDFPESDVYYDSLEGVEQEKYRRAIAREPLELINFIIREERPFTEVVTADYTVLNSYSARIYNNSDLTFADTANEKDYKAGKRYAMREGVKVELPNAGIMTSPMFLNRYPTSRTNRNRHRSMIILREFLATDILKVANRPIDAATASSYGNPTLEDPSCTVCHKVLDPIAGTFLKWDDNDYEKFEADNQWYADMVNPGFGEAKMTLADYPTSEAWLAEKIAADERFPRAVVNHLIKSLTGQGSLDFPSSGDANQIRGWEIQESDIRGFAKRFADANFNLKVLIKDIILSPYFRAKNAVGADEKTLATLDFIGTGRLLSPEALSRKFAATVGFNWWRYDKQPELTTTYNLLYGGIDSESVTARLDAPNGVMASLIWRMANETSCRATAFDFSKETDNRRLFPLVELTDSPSNSEAKIRKELQYLYSYLLGTSYETDSAEIDRAFDLFKGTFDDGQVAIGKDEAKGLPGTCQARWDYDNAGVDLASASQITKDENYVIRSWMSVLTYLLSDYEFTHE